MNTSKFNADEATLSVDLSEARQAVKESRFKDALSLLEIILESQPENIDSLYLAAVCSRYLKVFDESQKYLEGLLALAPDMGRAYQELGHLNRDMGNEDKSVMHYRQACELNPALLAPWKILYNYFKKNNNQPAADHALQQIRKLELEKSDLEASFKDTTMGYELMMKKSKELEELTNTIDNKMTRWMELEEKMG